jgi:hypothetical protein
MKTYFVIKALNHTTQPIAYWFSKEADFHSMPEPCCCFATKGAAITCIRNTETLHHYILTIEEIIIPWAIQG